ncbi:MAG: NAD(+) synthase [Phycisphaerales bacterium]
MAAALGGHANDGAASASGAAGALRTNGPDARASGSAPHLQDPLLAAPDERLVIDALTLGTRDYLAKTGFTSAVLGLSGGIDSAVTAAIACRAIGPANVLGLAMPSRYSSTHSVEDAHDLAARLDVRCIDIPIAESVSACAAALDQAFDLLKQPRLGASLPDITEENLQSRIRGLIAMGVSNRTGAIVLTTGNKSELAVGYSTLYGDMNGGLAVLSDVPKTMVYRLARHTNDHAAALGFPRPPIPERTITKPPSAELRPDQTDQDSLPPYDVLDRIIEGYVERRETPHTIIGRTGFDAETVLRVVRMIDIAEYKRKQLAIGLKVTGVAFGQGRRMPIAQRWRERA